MIEQFYLDRFPVLTMRDWRTASGDSYGLARWEKPLFSDAYPTVTSRLGFVMTPNGTHIFMEAQHYLHGLKYQLIGPGTMKVSEVEAAIAQYLPALIDDVLAQYKGWSDEIARLYESPINEAV